MKPGALVLVRHFLPGFRFGGQLRSVSNFTAALKDDLDLRVLCLDRDQGDDRPYAGIAAGRWTELDGIEVSYQRPGPVLAWRILQVLRQRRGDTLYLNGFFDPLFSIWPIVALWAGLAARRPVVLAARGEFSPGALGLKPIKKRAFLAVSRLLGFHRDVVWHATSQLEASDIEAAMGVARERMRLVNVIPATPQISEGSIRRGASRPFRLVFISRISRKKNLAGAIKAACLATAPVKLTILGSIEDAVYWSECQDLIAAAPGHVQIVHEGEVAYEDVPARLAAHDAFLLPTLGENFGHVIFETLAVGLPAIISDQTPWRGLREAGVGADLPIDPQAFARVIDEFAEMPATAYSAMRRRARVYALAWLAEQDALTEMRRLLTDPQGSLSAG